LEGTVATDSALPATVITPEALLEHWQGHRRLTRRVIGAFPEDQLFSFRVPPMRPFGLMALEFIGMAVPMVRGLATGDTGTAGQHHDPAWVRSFSDAASPKAAVLQRWDEDTDEINAMWAQIPSGRFQETVTAFGQFTGVASTLLIYVIDNEIHHRGQGYVYLRHLGIETPLFYVR
jgi:uncharacterized damage-inducible protein DinB